MKLAGRDIKVVAGDDGQAWVCFALSSADIHVLTAVFFSAADVCHAIKGKVRTAELTRFRENLEEVA